MDQIFNNLQLNKSAVLDVGCGREGKFVEFLSTYFEHVKAIDSDEEVAKKCAEKMKTLSNVNISTQDALQTRFDSASFDCITAFNTLHFLQDVPKFLREVDRILKPGGKLIVISRALFTLQQESLNSILHNCLNETFEEELKDYWSSDTAKRFNLYCDPERENAHQVFLYPDYKSKTLKDIQQFNILDLKDELMQFNVANLYLKKHSQEKFEEKIMQLQSRLMSEMDRDLSEMYFENVMLTKETILYVQINTK